MKGWSGSRLRINLSEGRIEREDLPRDELRSWIGGRGLNAHLLFNESQPGRDPFHPDTPFCLAVGPLTGSCAPCAAIVSVASRSPLLEPHTYAHASMGGHWGAEVKLAGYDQIVLTGAADRPTYVLIEDDTVELRDAAHLWGKDTHQTTISIQEELGDRGIRVLCIGEAGENLVRYASLINSFHWDAGRLGFGAILGSKNVKGVAVRGSRSVDVADPERFVSVCHHLRAKLEKDARTQRLGSEGTLLALQNTNRGAIGHGESRWHSAQKMSPQDYYDSFFFSKAGCFSCPINCGRYTYIKNGPFAGSHFGGVHGESVIALGPGIGITQWDHILKMIQTCVLYGLDPLSTGGTIAWAVDAFEKGLLTEHDVSGIAPLWGDADRALKTVTWIAERKGVGDVLAEGALRASRVLNHGSEQLVCHVKGIELAGPGPGGPDSSCLASRLSTVVSSGDWDHLRTWGWSDVRRTTGKGPESESESLGRRSDTASEASRGAEMAKSVEDAKCAADLSGVCSFPYARLPALSLSDLCEQFDALCGLHTAQEDLLRISERVIDLERAMAVRDGIGRADEVSCHESFRDATGDKQSRTVWESALSRYYELRGWDVETGHPRRGE